MEHDIKKMDPEGVFPSAECKASEWSYWCEAVS